MRQIGADIFFAHQPRDRDYVRTAFLRDEARDVLGVAPAARPDRDVQIFALRVQCGARQRQPVFPAVKTADCERAELVGTQAVAITTGPHQAFLVGWHEFAMHRADFTACVDVYHRTIQTVATAVSGALYRAEIDSNGVFFRGSANRVEITALNNDGLLGVMSEQFFLYL